MATFEFVFTLEHLLESFRRYRRVSRILRWYAHVRIFAVVLLVALAAMASYSAVLPSAVVFLVLALLLLFSRQLGEFVLRQQVRRSPFIDQRYVIHLRPDGVAIEGTLDSAKLAWAAFSQARAFPDGLLLFTGPKIFRWLPFAALVTGDASTANDIAFANIKDSAEAR